MRLSTTSFLILTGFLALSPVEGRACTCAAIPLEQQLAFADYAFAGTVVDVDTVDSNYSMGAYLIATIAVNKVWKGDVGAEFEVWTRQSSASCGYNDPWARFEIGEMFVLYAYDPSDFDDHITTNLCARNKKYSDAGADLDRLGPGSAPQPVDGHRGSPGFSLDEPHPQPITAQATVTLNVDVAQHVTVEVFDALGRRVAVLFDAAVSSDRQQILTFDAGDLPSGIYLLRTRGEKAVDVRTLIVQR